MSKLLRASWVFVLSVLSACSCSPSKTQPEASSAQTKGDPSLAASAATAAPNGEGVQTGEVQEARRNAKSVRLDDARWKAAMGDDPAAKQALADALGSTALLEALDDGEPIASTALVVLPLCEDAELALGPLSKRALAAPNEARGAVLESLLAVAGRPANAREPLDPEGAKEAGEAVLSLATNKELPKEHRALAISAARALAEKKLVDGAKIPTDLDPP